MMDTPRRRGQAKSARNGPRGWRRHPFRVLSQRRPDQSDQRPHADHRHPRITALLPRHAIVARRESEAGAGRDGSSGLHVVSVLPIMSRSRAKRRLVATTLPIFGTLGSREEREFYFQAAPSSSLRPVEPIARIAARGEPVAIAVIGGSAGKRPSWSEPASGRASRRSRRNCGRGWIAPPGPTSSADPSGSCSLVRRRTSGRGADSACGHETGKPRSRPAASCVRPSRSSRQEPLPRTLASSYNLPLSLTRDHGRRR